MLKLGQFRLDDLDRNYVAVVQLGSQPKNVIHQVTLRTDKVHRSLPNSIIRLGDTQGDEAAGWQYPQNIIIVAILGHAVKVASDMHGGNEEWKCVPIPDCLTDAA